MQTKITLLLIFLGVLPASILGFYALRNQDELLNANNQMLLGFSSHIRSEVARRIRGYRILLQSAAQMLPREQLAPSQCRAALELVLHQDQGQEQGLEGLALYDRSKRLLA